MNLKVPFQLAKNALRRPPHLAPLFLAALILYLSIAWFFLGMKAPWSPDEGAKYLQLTNLRLEAGKLGLDIPYGGRELDPSLEYALSEHPKDLLRVVGDKLSFERLPVFTLAVWPLYQLFGAKGLVIFPALFGALCTVLAVSVCPPPNRRLAMWVTIAFASPLFIYSTLFWEHSMATAFALAGAYLILNDLTDTGVSSNRRVLRWVLGGCALGAAAYVRLETILFSGALLFACWVLIEGRRSWVLLAGLVLILTLLPYQPAHRALFQGQPLPSNARYINLPLAHLRTVRWRAIPDLLVGPPEEGGIDAGWLGALWSAAAITSIAFSFNRSPALIWRTIKQLCLMICAAIAAYFLFTSTPYRAAHGLLFTTPWALLGFTRAAEVWAYGESRMRVLIGTYTLGLVGYALIILGIRASSPHGGLEWGARFALTFYASLALIAAWDWKSQPKIDRWMIIVIILLGVGFQVRGLLSIRNDLHTNGNLNQAILDLPEDQVLTDLWWLPLNAAPIQAGKEFYSIGSPGEGASLISVASERGIERVSLVTLDHALPTHIASYMGEFQDHDRGIDPGAGSIDLPSGDC